MTEAETVDEFGVSGLAAIQMSAREYAAFALMGLLAQGAHHHNCAAEVADIAADHGEALVREMDRREG